MMSTILKRTDIRTFCNKKLKASITVEAAFSFTLTVFVLFMMLGPLLIIKSTSDMLLDINAASRDRCNYELLKYRSTSSIAFNITTYGSQLYSFNNKYDEEHREYRNIKYLYDINLNVYDRNTGIVKLDYDVCFDVPYNVLRLSGLHNRLLIQRRAFIGSDGDRFDNAIDDGEYIYLANNYRNSGVYHTFIDCTYLIKNTYRYSFSEVEKQKNENNEKYSKCTYCFRNVHIDNNTICYVTQYGDKYHYKDNCPLMTAYVTKVPKEWIEEYNLRLCDKCRRKEENK